MPRTSRAGSYSAFTLIELMVVIVIIAVLIAILIPAVGGVRISAKRANTERQMNQIVQASGQFQTDERRLPGYFSATDMGSSDNVVQGFSSMQNVMLDLAGGVVAPGTSTNPPQGSILVGPYSNGAKNVYVSLEAIGVAGQGGKSYYVPDPKHFVPQTDTGQQSIPPGGLNAQLPSVVDEFGNPLLAWAVDERATHAFTQAADSTYFAKDNSGAAGIPNASLARFYLASNDAFLKATNLGRSGTDQTIGVKGSLIGPASTDPVTSLMGALGSPSYPFHDPSNPTGTPAYATAPRAPLMIHSAGADGVYFGMRDRGAKQFPGSVIDYKFNYASDGGTTMSATNQYLDKDGKPTNHDILSPFDDIIATGGN
jgi:prepilin-type N-terminal cleavage/methylation domain-containing protein